MLLLLLLFPCPCLSQPSILYSVQTCHTCIMSEGESLTNSQSGFSADCTLLSRLHTLHHFYFLPVLPPSPPPSSPACPPPCVHPTPRFLPTTFVSHLKWRGNASLWAHKWPILRAGWDWCLRSSCADLLPAPTGEWEITLRFPGEDAGQTGKETKVRERGTKDGMSCGR